MTKPSKSLLLSVSIFNLDFLHNLYGHPLKLTKLNVKNYPNLRLCCRKVHAKMIDHFIGRIT